MIAGSKGMSGAAYLSAKAAYAVGAGLVQIYTHEENRVILQQLLPEAIITTYDTFDSEQLEKLIQWADLIGIGCGLGKSDTAERVMQYTLERALVPCVVDADGINIHKLKGLQIYRQVFMFWMKDRYRLPAVERFINYMKEQQAEDANDTENVSKVYLKDIVNF